MASSRETAGSTKANISWLKPAQVEAMRDAAHHGNHGPRDEAIVTLLYDTGLRRGEAAQLTVDMLDLEDGHLRIPSQIQKGHPGDTAPKPQTFALDRSGTLRTEKTLRAYLNEHADQHGRHPLFVSQKGGALTGKAINDVVKRLATAADLQPYLTGGRGSPADVSAHTLRHSVAWRMLRAEAGHTMYDVRNRLRHSTLLTTERNYDHFDVI
jgi:integrase